MKVETLWQDIRFGARLLVRQPGFAAIAVLTLALGIGANTAIFSVVDAVLLKPLPFEEPERLLMVWERNYKRGRDRNVVGPANYMAWKEQNQSFERLAAFVPWTANIAGEGEPERVPIGAVAAEFFATLGAQAALGRVFLPEDGKPGAPNVVVLSHGLWQRRFGGNPQVIEQTLLVNAQPHTIIGVAPPYFKVPPRAELWVPIQFGEQHRRARGRSLAVIGRLKPGVSTEQAQAEMEVLARRREAEDSDFNAGWSAHVVPLREQLVGGIRTALLVLLGAVGFVLLIACANVANLLLARATVREKELAIRAALGASRARLAGQLLIESLLLALLSAAAGLLVAEAGLRGLLAIVPTDVPQLVAIGLNHTVLAFTLGVALLTGLLFGLVPALHFSSPDLHSSLKEGGRSSGMAPGRHWLRHGLVVAEVAMALVLLAGAGLLIRSLGQLQSVDPGFRPQNLLALQLSLAGAKYAEGHQQTQFFQQALARIEQLPRVESAAAISWLPLGGPGSGTSFMALDRERPKVGDEPVADIRIVTPGLFRTMGIPLQRGRDFSPQDAAEAPPVVVINETLAQQFWAKGDPIGKRIAMSWGAGAWREAEIVGVVGDVHLTALDTAPRFTLYWPHAQLANSFMSVMVHTKVEPTSLAGEIRRQIYALDPDQPVADVQPMQAVLAKSLQRPRFTVILLGVFSSLALVLGAIGIYGVISYSVSQRRHEMGIRMALGAQPGDILRLVIGQGLRLALVGVAIGLAGAFAVTRVLASLLFQVSATDPLTFAATPALLVGVALLACYIPARRATRVDPMVALRYE